MEEYEEGKAAALEGKEIWENPYANSDCSQRKFRFWLAGWCFGMQQREK